MKKRLLCLFLMIALFIVGCAKDQKTSSAQLIDEKTQTIDLYFGTSNGYLSKETRKINEQLDASAGQKIIEGLLSGPTDSALHPVFPEGTKCLNYTYDSQEKLATVDFSKELQQATGSTGERLAVYSVVNSLVALQGIGQVQILIEGNVVESVSGHLYTAEPLDADLSIVQQ